jgi:hypothetical protein
MEFLVRGATQFGEPGVFMAFEERTEELAQNFASLGYDLNMLVAQNKLSLDFVRVERSEIEEAGEYDLELFASRDGNDSGNGRLTRYAIEDRTLDLDVADNRDRTVTFDAVRPDGTGAIAIEVTVSPEGMARFAYAGSLVVTRAR